MLSLPSQWQITPLTRREGEPQGLSDWPFHHPGHKCVTWSGTSYLGLHVKLVLTLHTS
jgi:hypothetical protein